MPWSRFSRRSPPRLLDSTLDTSASVAGVLSNVNREAPGGASTHAGAIHLFTRSTYARVSSPSSHNRLLAGIQRSRELADHDAAAIFARFTGAAGR